jgi:hypothetical protein
MKYSVHPFLFICISSLLWSQNPIYVVLRIDDIQSRNTSYLPKNISAFEQVAEAHGAKVTYVTIPHRLIETGVNNGSLTSELKNSILHGHEIAQHGNNHICTRCGSTGHEMYCDTYKSAISRKVQDSLIVNGMKLLLDSLGVVPHLFVSPGHYEDTTTYNLLTEHQFPNISTTKSVRGEVVKNLFNVPSTNEYTWSMTASTYRSQFDIAMNDFRSVGEGTGCFVFLFHDPFTRQGYLNGIVIQWMGEMLDSLKTNYGNRIKFVTLSEAADHFKVQTNVATIATGIPDHFFLEQNFPNPFNPATTISYQIPTADCVKLTVYDMMGREAAVLVNKEQPAGRYTVQFDGKKMSSGLYFYQMQSGKIVETKRMLLLK